MASGSQSPFDPSTDPRSRYDYTSAAVDSAIAADLKEVVEGDVRFDAYTRQLFSTDASAYQILPIGVVFPKSTADVVAVMEYCWSESIPVLPRGGGTSLAGQAINEAVVLDFTRYMTEIVDFDPDNQLVTAQPGIILSNLNAAVAEHGLKFAPDPSTADRSALGGAIGNNSTGAHSLVYGKTDAYVESVEAVLADGTVMTLGEMRVAELREHADPTAPDLFPQIAATLIRIIDDEREAIEAVYPALKRNVSGYNLIDLVRSAMDDSEVGPTVNLAKLLVGSEGTLATVTEATVSLESIPPAKSVAVLTYSELLDAMNDVAPILEHEPAAVEVLDDLLLELARELDEFSDVLSMLPDGTVTFLLVEFYADSDEAAAENVQTLIADRVGDLAFDALEAYSETDRAKLWKMRKASTPILMSRTTDEKHHAFIEDIAIPPQHLADYVVDFRRVMADHGTTGSFYAHAGPGCMHVRPLVNTKTHDGIEQMEAIADAATDIAIKYGGAVSGEHGDGRARTQWNQKMYGDHVWELFREVKSAFDPDWLLNPGSVCGDHRMTEHFRYDPEYQFDSGFEPGLNWDIDNGFQGMVELCHGCGGCRGDQATTGGVMCPTYRAAHEEITSTRGRANLMRLAMSGSLPEKEHLDTEFMHEVLDLCVGCKGCSRDCPSEVDLAKLKVEVANAYHHEHGSSIRSKLFADIDRYSAIASSFAPLSNVVIKIPGTRLVMEKALGIARERSLPTFYRESFEEWFTNRGGAAVDPADATAKAVLLPDTYINYSDPAVGRDAVRVLESLGVHVVIPDELAESGRAAYSGGFIDKARTRAERNVEILAPFVDDEWSILCLEPSDAVMLQSDYLDLCSGPAVDAVSNNTYGVMEYLDKTDLLSSLPTDQPETSVTYHGHCHQKSTKKDHHTAAVLRKIGYSVNQLDSTCCGMAGSFGYEAEHYSMSQAIGRILFDQVNASDTDLVTAPGASCRTQLGDEFGEKPRHPISLVADVFPSKN